MKDIRLYQDAFGTWRLEADGTDMTDAVTVLSQIRARARDLVRIDDNAEYRSACATFVSTIATSGKAGA